MGCLIGKVTSLHLAFEYQRALEVVLPEAGARGLGKETVSLSQLGIGFGPCLVVGGLNIHFAGYWFWVSACGYSQSYGKTESDWMVRASVTRRVQECLV